MKKNIYILVIVAAFLAASCGKEKAPNSSSNADETTVVISDSSLRLMGVKLAPMTEKVIERYHYLNGKVVSLPNYRATVSSDIEGKVGKIFVREGELVKAGQPLLTLRSMALIELQGDYLEARSQAEFLTVEYRRQEELIKNNVGALADFQVTESKYKAAQGRLNALSARLRLLGIPTEGLEKELHTEAIIRSPIDGHVFHLMVETGAVAATNVALVELINTSQLMADVFVYDNDLDDIHEGQEVVIDFINHLYPSVKGKVVSLARAFDPETKAVRAHISFRAPEGKLILPDMSVRCILIKGESLKPGPTLPRAAILVEEDHDFIYITYPDQKKGTDYVLRKERISIVGENEQEIQIRFHNQPESGYMVVLSNVMIVENQRKKLNGMVME